MSLLSEKIVAEGFTFDDLLLLPAYSEVLPRQVSIASNLTQSVRLELPILSAAMDTVTESAMAIALAREGAIGVIHKNMSIEQQAFQVREVKRAENRMITDPVTISPDATVGYALSIMRENHIGGIPVVDSDNRLVGIVTNRDLRFQEDNSRKVSEVMTSDNLITTTEGTDLTQAAEILQRHKIEKLPVVDAQYRLIGLLTYRDITKVRANPLATKDRKGRLMAAAGVGVTKDTLERVQALVQAGVDVVVIDTAHGHSRGVVEMLRRVRGEFPELQLVVGNIATAEAALMLANAGANAVKVGIGPGSICTTRIIAGVGVPQVQAIYDVAKALRGSEVKVIADGGIRYSGDIAKAIAAGADTVMVGSLLAGTEESPGDTILFNGRRYKAYRGMGSLEAMQHGSKDRYFQDVEDDIKKLVPEGIAARVPYTGAASEVIYQLMGGLRAGMGYCGAPTIAAMQQAKFVRITNAGILESHPHDVAITSEAPNYSSKSN
jgi:inosine-5'-monophosphate dehydrogenase